MSIFSCMKFIKFLFLRNSVATSPALAKNGASIFHYIQAQFSYSFIVLILNVYYYLYIYMKA